MNEISALIKNYKPKQGFHLSMAKFIAHFLVTVIDRRTVNLSELALRMADAIKKRLGLQEATTLFSVLCLAL